MTLTFRIEGICKMYGAEEGESPGFIAKCIEDALADWKDIDAKIVVLDYEEGPDR